MTERKIKTVNKQQDELSHGFKKTKSEIIKKVKEKEWKEEVLEFKEQLNKDSDGA